MWGSASRGAANLLAEVSPGNPFLVAAAAGAYFVEEAGWTRDVEEAVKALFTGETPAQPDCSRPKQGGKVHLCLDHGACGSWPGWVPAGKPLGCLGLHPDWWGTSISPTSRGSSPPQAKAHPTMDRRKM